MILYRKPRPATALKKTRAFTWLWRCDSIRPEAPAGISCTSKGGAMTTDWKPHCSEAASLYCYIYIYICICIYIYVYIYIYLGSQENKFILLYILGCQETSFCWWLWGTLAALALPILPSDPMASQKKSTRNPAIANNNPFPLQATAEIETHPVVLIAPCSYTSNAPLENGHMQYRIRSYHTIYIHISYHVSYNHGLRSLFFGTFWGWTMVHHGWSFCFCVCIWFHGVPSGYVIA